MKRTVILFPRQDSFNGGTDFFGGASSTFLDSFPNGSPYGGSASIALWEAWRDEGATTDPSGGICSGSGGVGNTLPCRYASANGYGRTTGAKINSSVRVDAPPTLSLYDKVTLHAWFDYAGTGANLFDFPGGFEPNAHGPQLKLQFRNRANSGWNVGPTLYEGGYDGATGNPVGNRYCNMNQPSCGAGYDGLIHATWVMSTGHPEGGPWTQDDLVHFDGGVYVELAAPVYQAGQPFPRVRVFRFHVELEVQDLGGYVKNEQHDASLNLRLFRKSRNQVVVQAPADETYVPLGSRRRISHEDGPAIDEGGWGDKKLTRRDTQLIQRSYYPDQFQAVDTCFDLRDFSTNLWLAAMIDTAWTPELNGVAYLDRGDGYVYARAAQDAWSPRPGDGVHLRVLKDLPNVSYRGLSITAGGDDEVSLRNSNVQGAGWSVVDTGGVATATPTLGNGLVDELGFLDAVQVAYSTGKRAYQRTLGTFPKTGGHLLHLRAIARVVAVTTPATNHLEVVLWREYLVATVPTTAYWDAASRTWSVGTPVYNELSASGAFGELISDGITCDVTADADPTYKVKIGRSSTNINATFILALVDVQHGGPSKGNSYGARPPLVSLDSVITRVADDFTVANAPHVCWFQDRGVAILEFEPQWRTDLLPTSETKPLYYVQHDSAGTTSYDRLDYVKGSPSVLKFKRHVDGVGDFEVSVPVTTALTRDHVLKAYARWLDADGWEGFGPRAITVGFAVFTTADGTLVEQGQATGEGYAGDVPLDGTPANRFIRLGRDGAGNYLDGYVRMVDIFRNPRAHAENVWRR